MSDSLQSSQNVFKQPDNQEKSQKRSVVEQLDERAAQLSIGMYHPKAGTRDSGGIAMFAQEMIDAIATNQPAYLYTEMGELTPKMQQTDAKVIQSASSTENELPWTLSEYLPIPGPDFSMELQQRLQTLVGMIRDGTIQHMNEHVDVLITHELPDDILISNILNIPVICIYHGFSQVGIGTRAHELLSSSYSVVNSIQTRKEFIEHLGEVPDGIVYPGVDVDLFNPDATPVVERKEWTILFVGRFVPAKGVFDLIDAVAQMSEDVHLHLIGRGDFDALMERVTKHGLESAVTIDESIPHDTLPGFYTAADVMCLPSHYESFGMVNLEAMACGTPVVTTDIPGITEYATDGETALVVPPKRPDKLAEAMETLRTSPALQTHLSKNGQATAERYSWELSARKLVNKCLTIVEKNRV